MTGWTRRISRRVTAWTPHLGRSALPPPPPPPPPSLQLLALTANVVTENAAAGTVIGSILNRTAGSQLSLFTGAGGKVALVGTDIVVGATNIDYEDGSSFTFRIAETLSWGASLTTTLTINVVNLNDTNPAAFSFTPATGAATSTLETSNTITIVGLGLSDTVTATLSGSGTSQLSLNGGAWQAGPVTIAENDTIAVRHTSSSSPSTAVSTTLTVGTTSATFTSTTASPSNPLDAPVLTQTSTVGSNPLTWSALYSNSVEYDGAGNGDKVRMRWRLNGGSWTTEADQGLDSATLLAGTYTWPLYNATTFSSGGLIEVQEQKARFVSGVETLTSNWSTILGDTIAAIVAGGTTWNNASPNKPTITAFSNANLTIEITANSNTISPTGVNVQCPTSKGIPSGVKAYFETTCNVLGGDMALFASSHNAASFGPGSSENKGINYSNTGNVNKNGSTAAVWATWTTGNTICWAVDTVNYRAWARVNGGNWNNSGTADPATNTGGFDISNMNLASNNIYASPNFSNSGSKHTLNAGASSFAQTAPSGFSTLNSVGV